MNTREQKGLELSAGAHLWKREGQDWLIPSESEVGRYYRVGSGRCTCRDFETRGGECKHQYALGFHLDAILALEKSGVDALVEFARMLAER